MLRVVSLTILALFVLIAPAWAQDYKTAKKKAKVAYNSAQYTEAIKAYKEMLGYKPDDSKAHYSLALAVLKTRHDNNDMVAFYNDLPVTKSKAIELAAYKYKGEENHVLAETLYEKVMALNPKHEIGATYLSEHFYEAGNYEKGYKYYMMKANIVKYRKYEAFYYAGESAMKIEQWANGLDAFEKALKACNKKDEPHDYKVIGGKVQWAEIEVANEPIRQQLMANPIDIEIENLGTAVNSDKGDYFGSVTADESMLLFTSRREGSFGSKSSDDQQWPEDFWYCEKDDEGNWTEAKNLGEPINSDSHEGLPALSADGQTIYFYMSGPQGDGNIYESTINGDKWSKPEKMRFCSYETWESQATISSDGTKIFFLTKRDKKDEDNSDIWFAERKRSGKWSKAKPLSDVINTQYRESSPFIHPDGRTLYFASEGHGCVGGFDIFKSVYNEETGEWSKPVNIGYPINTKENEQGFFLNAMGNRAYLHSSREGGEGGYDMYVIHLTGKPKPEAEPVASAEEEVVIVEEKKAPETVAATAVTTVTGYVTDEETGKPIGAAIEMQNLTKGEIIQDVVSNSKTGKFVVVLPAGYNYGISVNKDGYLFHSENFNIPKESFSSLVKKDIELKKIKVGKKIVLNNIFFESGKADLNDQSTLELQKIVEFMNKQSSVKIEISGHTDNVGSDASNQSLSEARAKSVVSYLTSNGVDASRLVAKGYGENDPITTNDTEDGRAKNRRTEFKVIQ